MAVVALSDGKACGSDQVGADELSASFAQVMTALLGSVMPAGDDAVAPASRPVVRLGLACSGGLDSMALMTLMAQWLGSAACQSACQSFSPSVSVSVCVFHIHHGLSPFADAWLAHVRKQAGHCQMPFDAVRIDPPHVPGRSIEEVARERRYAALADLCRQYRCTALLCAHHQDDQAETVLMQLLRGAGVAGLRGMPFHQTLQTPQDTPRNPPQDTSLPVSLIRPLLAYSRAQLQACVRMQGTEWVEDESNLDHKYARNALRHQLMPVLHELAPGFTERLARTAGHMQDAARGLDDLAALDLAQCRVAAQQDSLSLARWRLLADHRRINLLRYWLRLAAPSLRLPSSSWMTELARQLNDIGLDAQCCVSYPGFAADAARRYEVRCYRDQIALVQAEAGLAGDEIHEVRWPFAWRDESRIDVPAFAGALTFTRVAAVDGNADVPGIPADWLRRQSLVAQSGPGSIRIKPGPRRSTRSVRHHYQERGIPAWERAQLPLVLTLSGTPVFAAGIGTDCRAGRDSASTGDVVHVQIGWEPDGQSKPEENLF